MFPLSSCPSFPAHYDLYTMLCCQWGFAETGKRMGGVKPVNHCSVHCRLAKFHGLTTRVKNGDVIGFKKSIAWKLLPITYKKRVSRPIIAPYLTLIIIPRNFDKRPCKLQWLTPPRKLCFITTVRPDCHAHHP